MCPKFFPDIDFLPGGYREDQCDGWCYHPGLVDWTDEENDEDDVDDYDED